MKQVSPNQLTDAFSAFSDAASPYGGLVQAEVPRPSFQELVLWAIRERVAIEPDGYIKIRPRAKLPGFAGLRAIVLIPRRNQQPNRVAGIVLEDEERIGVLGGHEVFSPLVQSQLDTLYLNNRRSVLEHPGGQPRAGYGGHAVVGASALALRGNPHQALHDFTPKTFGAELTRQGLQDIHVGRNQVIPLRQGAFTLSQVGLEVAGHYQPHTSDMLGSGLTGEAANVAWTAAAAISNPETHGRLNFARNLAAMTM
ncbi:hypothetical protein IPP75_00120 [Candidatus Saccharibacteria bacterium]|nr:MAG: hypothetical protein IPP75_00120 [Candidatus Saccharibacteria bacterium]